LGFALATLASSWDKLSTVIEGGIENITFLKLVVSGARHGLDFGGGWPSLAPERSEVSIITLDAENDGRLRWGTIFSALRCFGIPNCMEVTLLGRNQDNNTPVP